jgi:hypothetical protein
MNNKKSGRDPEMTTRGLYTHLSDEQSKKNQFGQAARPNAEIEFLEDKEHRWDRIFELLESEINSQ